MMWAEAEAEEEAEVEGVLGWVWRCACWGLWV